jgi:ATP:ADP antiporter, AAA family
VILKKLGSLVDVRAGEHRLVLLMGTNYFLLLLFYYLIKPARDSLFLVELSPEKLPFVYILTAIVAAPVTAAYARAGLSRRLDRLISLTTMILVVSLLVLRWMLLNPQPWTVFAFYTWAAMAGVLTTSQFWLLANGLYDASSAKRIFPILGLGGIAGAFCGGEVTSFLMVNEYLNTVDLLLVGAGALVVAGALSCLTWGLFGENSDTKDETGAADENVWRIPDIIKIVSRSSHLRWMAAIIILTVMTGSFIDFQFKTVSWQAFDNQAELTAFLGKFYGRMSLLAFFVQALLAQRLIRLLGVGGALPVLPAILAVGSGIMLMAPGLLAGMVLRGGDMIFKYSLDRTSRELLFLPIPLVLKKRTKVFLDVFVDRWARGLAGGLLLLCSVVLDFELHHITLISLVLLFLWLVATFFMRREYMNTFRNAVTRRDVNIGSSGVQLTDQGAITVLLGVLDSGREREILYALEMLEGVPAKGVAQSVRPLVRHESAEVRRRSLEILLQCGELEDRSLAEAATCDEDLGVREAAVGFLVAHGSSRGPARLFLAEMLAGDPPCRNAALAYITKHDAAGVFRELVTRLVVDVVKKDNGIWGLEGRQVLGLLPWTPVGCTTRLWDDLLADGSVEVVRYAVRGLGVRKDLPRVGWLIGRLGDQQLKTETREAMVLLARADDAVITQLESFFLDQSKPALKRGEVPRILAKVPSDQSVRILLQHLAARNPELRFGVLKALGKLRTHYPHLAFKPSIVVEEISTEAQHFLQLKQLTGLLPEGGPAADLLHQTISETQQLRLESVFRLLGLVYPASDLFSAYLGITGGNRIQRANALEFLDNLLTAPHRNLIRALVDASDQNRIDADLGIRVGDPARTTTEALDFLGSSCDPWLASCAIFAGGGVENPASAAFLEKSGDQMLSVIEKVLLLQNVDVFTQIPTDKLAQLAAIARERFVISGESLYHQHDRPDALYLVLEGTVGLYDGEKEIRQVKNHSPFGTWALFDGEPRAMTATALEDSRLLRIDRSEFTDLLSEDVRITQGVLTALARQLRKVAEKEI